MPYPPNPQYPGEEKSYDPVHNVWIRAGDCFVAEKILGWKWYPIGSKRDFCGNPFHVILARAEPDLRYVLEPDTQVPNFMTSLSDALTVARKVGIGQIDVLPTDREMAKAICDKAISST